MDGDSDCLFRRLCDWLCCRVRLGPDLSDDEIGLNEISGVDPDQGDRIGGREVDHGIPRDDIVADRGMQGVPISKAVSMHVDEIVLRRRTANC
jgi:hypothetical protein